MLTRTAMRLIPWLRCMAVLLLAVPALAATDTQRVVTTQVRAELVAHAPQGVVPGGTLKLGLLIDHQPQWHTYWKNPGDSGLPTSLRWTLPDGVTAGDIEWPTPSKLPLGPLLNYGYEDRLLLPVTVQVPADFRGDELDVSLQADWLVCKDVCIPEQGEFRLRVPARAATATHGADFAAAQAAQPRPLPQAQGLATVSEGALELQVTGLPAAWQGLAVAFFPETPGVIQNAAVPVTRWEGATWHAQVPLDPQRSEGPQAMPAVFTTPSEAAGVSLTLSVQGSWPAIGTLPPLPAVEPPLPTAAPLPPASTLGLPLAIGFALIGGLLLNLMPCVFPVLSLKVLGFARHGAQRGHLLAGGLAYTAGVVLSFMALATLLLALRAGGEQLGWGFQLQSPWVVAALAALFTLIGLNLAGMFELGSLLPDRLATLQVRHPLVDSALTGVLAVAVAAPCTAPFMGASLGLAVTLPGAQALTVFAALGLGMALPYLAASAWPAAARALPRPGPWMADLQGPDGVPDVRHRGLAGLGAGAAGRHRRRGRAAGPAGGTGLRGLGAGRARAPVPHPGDARRGRGCPAGGRTASGQRRPCARTRWPPRPGPAPRPGSPGRPSAWPTPWPPGGRCSSTSPPPGA